MFIKLVNSISEVERTQWNQLLNSDDPFLKHEFLSALENTGAVGEQSGWLPRHCVVYAAQNKPETLIAVMPMYEKYNSNGEYIFDHAWANAYQQNDLDYFPKWVTSIPFTPCEGARLIIQKDHDRGEVTHAVIEFIKQKSIKDNISSWHCLFPNVYQKQHFHNENLIIREGVQFRWNNEDYTSFDDYLATFSAKKRKNVKRERRWVKEQGIELIRLHGDEINQQHWEAFYPFYQMTYFKRNMPPYLPLSFFHELTKTMPEQLLLIMAVKDEKYIGAALSLTGGDTLYGRYWGCLDEYHSLHFEACYYQGLEYCIDNKLKYFDSGAQGEHKISRGFKPVTTYSAHWIKDSKFSTAIERYVQQESQSMLEYKESAKEWLPFKQQ